MKRYDVVVNKYNGKDTIELEDGYWVKYDDVVEMLDHLVNLLDYDSFSSKDKIQRRAYLKGIIAELLAHGLNC